MTFRKGPFSVSGPGLRPMNIPPSLPSSFIQVMPDYEQFPLSLQGVEERCHPTRLPFGALGGSDTSLESESLLLSP